MKKIVLLLALCGLGLSVQAQLYFSCTHRNYYQYNTETEELDYTDGYDENSLFKIYPSMTMFEHITPDISSTYYASEYNYDEENNIITFNCMSDVGNKYMYIFDIDNSIIRVIFLNEDLEGNVLTFTVKKYWYDE